MKSSGIERPRSKRGFCFVTVNASFPSRCRIGCVTRLVGTGRRMAIRAQYGAPHSWLVEKRDGEVLGMWHRIRGVRRMNVLWKSLAPFAIALVLLFAPGVSHALQKGPDGQCPPNTSLDRSKPADPCQPTTDLPTVGVTGLRLVDISPWGWSSPWDSLSGYYRPGETGADGGGVTQNAVGIPLAQKLQKSACEGGDKATTEVGGAGVRASSRPVLVATGTKLQPEGDIPPIGGGTPLELGRLYTGGNTKIGAFGQGWTSSLDYTLVFEYDTLICCRIAASSFHAPDASTR